MHSYYCELPQRAQVAPFDLQTIICNLLKQLVEDV